MSTLGSDCVISFFLKKQRGNSRCHSFYSEKQCPFFFFFKISFPISNMLFDYGVIKFHFKEIWGRKFLSEFGFYLLGFNLLLVSVPDTFYGQRLSIRVGIRSAWRTLNKLHMPALKPCISFGVKLHTEAFHLKKWSSVLLKCLQHLVQVSGIKETTQKELEHSHWEQIYLKTLHCQHHTWHLLLMWQWKPHLLCRAMMFSTQIACWSHF